MGARRTAAAAAASVILWSAPEGPHRIPKDSLGRPWDPRGHPVEATWFQNVLQNEGTLPGRFQTLPGRLHNFFGSI